MAEFIKTSFDDGGFTFFLQNIKGSKLKTALKSGLRKSLNIIKKKAVENLKGLKFKKGSLNTSEKVLFKKYHKGQKTLYVLPSFASGVMVKLFKDGSGGRAEIIGKGKNYNPILKMIENGKGNRRTNKHSTGSIARNFFSSAVSSTKTQVQQSLQKNLEQAIIRAKERFNNK